MLNILLMTLFMTVLGGFVGAEEPDEPDAEEVEQDEQELDVGYRNQVRYREDYIPYISIDSLFENLAVGEVLIISRHQNQITIRKSGGDVTPYPEISDSLRR